MQWITIGKVETEDRTPTYWQEKLVRNRNASEFEAKVRANGTVAFLSEHWLTAENDNEAIAAIVERDREIQKRVLYIASDFPGKCGSSLN